MAYVACASPVLHYTTNTAQQIQDHALYQQSILKTDQNGEVISVQPYDSTYLPETKYGGEVEDHNAYLIPDIISKILSTVSIFLNINTAKFSSKKNCKPQPLLMKVN